MPLLKIQTFHAGGHHASCKQRSGYLERDGRALSVTTHNISNPARWYDEMDQTRRSFATRGDVTYREFIISADERDHASPEQIRELAFDWARTNFRNCEIAIIVHDDGKERLREGREGLPHAHAVVGAIDLERQTKISISNERVRTLHNSLQDMARERGLSEMERYRKGERLHSRQERQRTQAERQIERDGRESWKASVRDMALQAKERSHNLDEFRAALRACDVDLEVRKGRVYLVDRDNPNRACRADRLDSRLSAQDLGRKFERADRQDLSPEARARHLAKKLRDEIQHGSRRDDPRRNAAPQYKIREREEKQERLISRERNACADRTDRGNRESHAIERTSDLLRLASAAIPYGNGPARVEDDGTHTIKHHKQRTKDHSRAFGRDDGRER